MNAECGMRSAECGVWTLDMESIRRVDSSGRYRSPLDDPLPTVCGLTKRRARSASGDRDPAWSAGQRHVIPRANSRPGQE